MCKENTLAEKPEYSTVFDGGYLRLVEKQHKARYVFIAEESRLTQGSL